VKPGLSGRLPTLALGETRPYAWSRTRDFCFHAKAEALVSVAVILTDSPEELRAVVS
jgi:hypothetical protein